MELPGSIAVAKQGLPVTGEMLKYRWFPLWRGYVCLMCAMKRLHKFWKNAIFIPYAKIEVTRMNVKLKGI